MSLSAARILTTPLPPLVCSRSSTFSIGSPMNFSAPCCSSASRPHRMSLLAKNIPQHDGAGRESRLLEADRLEPRGELVGRHTRLADARQVALDVGHEHRRADSGESLGHDLERYGLAGPGGTGD